MSTGEHQKCLNAESDFGFGVPAFQMNENTINLILNIPQYYSEDVLTAHAPSLCYSRMKSLKTKYRYCLTVVPLNVLQLAIP